jgi:hypothetical protein
MGGLPSLPSLPPLNQLLTGTQVRPARNTAEAIQDTLADIERTTARRLQQARETGLMEEAIWEYIDASQRRRLQLRGTHPPRRRGRPKGTYSIPNEKLLADMRYARELLRAKGETVTQRNLMRAMGRQGDDKRVRDWCDQLGIAWDDFRQENL